jgi:predicted nucleic acid-binding protein
MIQVSLDTSFLISFVDPGRQHHEAAVHYFRYRLENNFQMWISTIAAGEFEVGQPIQDLPLRNFRVEPYNLLHAIRAAAFYRSLRESAQGQATERRPLIINDVKILAQAHEEGIGLVLTEDANTLTRMASRLRTLNQTAVRTLLLSEGFTPQRLLNPEQQELPLPNRSG